MDPDESTAERSGPASGAASGESTHVGLTFSPELTTRPPAGPAQARPAADGRATLELPGKSPDGVAAAAPGGGPAAAGGLGGGSRVGGVDTPTPPEGWPNIADYWPDAPQRMGPPADLHEDPAAAPTRIGAPWQQGADAHENSGAAPTRIGVSWRQGADAHENSGAAPRRIGVSWPEGAVRAAVLGRAADATKPKRRGRVLAGAGLAVLLLVGGGFAAYRKMAQESSLAGPPPAVSVSTAPAPEPVASGAMGPAVVLPEQSAPTTATSEPAQPEPARPKAGTFWLVDDVSDITIRTKKLDQGIVEVGRPDGSDAKPRTTVDGGDVKLRLDKGGRHTDVDVRLDNRVEWTIRLDGGARTMTVDLGGAELRSVTFGGGVARLDLTLPRLDGTLSIAMNGGVNQWRITTEGRVKVRVAAAKGAGHVVLYGRDRGGMGRGDRVEADGRDGIDVNAGAGFGSLTVVGS
jgi:hypothetical protein